MRLYEILKPLNEEKIDVTKFDNWVRYDEKSIDIDFNEYKLKESKKWERRAVMFGFRFPLFDTLEYFKNALETSPIVNVDSLNNVANMTKNTSIDDIKGMVGGYQMPRDVDRIVQGYQNNVKMPLPIILKGDKGLHIMAGNTRQSIARAMGITPKALLVDVSAKSQSK
jgi:hypothetical protein